MGVPNLNDRHFRDAKSLLLQRDFASTERGRTACGPGDQPRIREGCATLARRSDADPQRDSDGGGRTRTDDPGRTGPPRAPRKRPRGPEGIETMNAEQVQEILTRRATSLMYRCLPLLNVCGIEEAWIAGSSMNDA